MSKAALEAASAYVSPTSYQRDLFFVSFSPDFIYSENPVAFSGRHH